MYIAITFYEYVDYRCSPNMNEIIHSSTAEFWGFSCYEIGLTPATQIPQLLSVAIKPTVTCKVMKEPQPLLRINHLS